MSAEPPSLLVAAFSGRALAASARRAGFAPLVADAFGDVDTRQIAGGVEVLPDAFAHGFRVRTLIAALDQLAASAPTPPAGLVLGAGFEDAPGLVARLADRFPLLGCPAATISHAKDPLRLAALLRDLGIATPETSIAPPPDGTGWLSKRIGGSGGGHVAVCRASVKGQRDRYYQRRIDGDLVSMLGVMRGRRAAFAFTTQWCSPIPRRPFRFGGIAGPVDIEADLEARLVDIGLDVGAALGLVGLVSFDFVVANGEPYLVDVNPRPSASLDVLDDAAGTLFKAHIAACGGGDPVEVLAREWRPRRAAGLRYVYADASDFAAPALDWPDWTSDRPLPATRIRRYQPIATIHAAGTTLAEVEQSLDERASELERLLHPA